MKDVRTKPAKQGNVKRGSSGERGVVDFEHESHLGSCWKLASVKYEEDSCLLVVLEVAVVVSRAWLEVAYLPLHLTCLSCIVCEEVVIQLE